MFTNYNINQPFEGEKILAALENTVMQTLHILSFMVESKKALCFGVFDSQ